MLSWDEAAMMPRGGGDARGEALGHIAALIHQKLSDPEIGELLDKAEASNAALSDWQRANLRAMRRMQVRATALPQSLVRALKIATTRCEQTWRLARAANEWDAIARQLAEVLMLTREKAAALGNALELQPYDALLDGYEAGTRAIDVARVFDDLKGFLPDFISRILNRQREPLPLRGPFPRERQRELGVAMMRVFDFDFDRGRLDVSHHPSAAASPTTPHHHPCSESDFLPSLMAVLHETGHALYQQNLPVEWRRQPVGGSLGAVVHESQSLFVEMQVARSRAFMEFAAPQIRAHLPGTNGDAAWSQKICMRTPSGCVARTSALTPTK